MINEVQIRNFKSIKSLDIACKRINVFVGKPNVGKSNIIEALSLFGFGYYHHQDMLRSMIRMNNVQELFYRKDIKKPIYINTDIGSINLAFHTMDTYFLMIDPQKKVAREDFRVTYSTLNDMQRFFYQKYEKEQWAPFDLTPLFTTLNNNIGTYNINGFNAEAPLTFYSPIKRYSFKEFPHKPTSLFYGHSLVAPYGENIVTVLYSERELLEYFAEIFKNEYDLNLVVKDPENVLEIQIKEGIVANAIPINLVADTLQRLMFYLTAIKSNTNSTLLLEEPENHSFPNYINLLADNIARSTGNQFFITTHSPYLLRTLLEETPKEDLSIFITTYKDHQTHLHNLTDAEISELLDYNIDLFYNYEKFVG